MSRANSLEVALHIADATIRNLESQNQALQEENESLVLFVKEAHEETLALQERAEKAERDLVTASENLSKLCDAVPMATLVSIRDTARRIGLSGLSPTQETDCDAH